MNEHMKARIHSLWIAVVAMIFAFGCQDTTTPAASLEVERKLQHVNVDPSVTMTLVMKPL